MSLLLFEGRERFGSVGNESQRRLLFIALPIVLDVEGTIGVYVAQIEIDIEQFLVNPNIPEIHHYPSPVEGVLPIPGCYRRADWDSESGGIDYIVES